MAEHWKISVPVAKKAKMFWKELFSAITMLHDKKSCLYCFMLSVYYIQEIGKFSNEHEVQISPVNSFTLNTEDLERSYYKTWFFNNFLTKYHCIQFIDLIGLLE